MDGNSKPGETGTKKSNIFILIYPVFLAFLLIMNPCAYAAHGESESDTGSNLPRGSETQQSETEPDSEERAGVGVFKMDHINGQVRSLNRQRESLNIISALSHIEMIRNTDYTIHSAMKRVSGVQVDRRGRINLRGAGPGRYLVTLDGHHFGTTGAGDRSFNLDAISVDQIRDLEVIKVLTPDMDAEAMAGTINLVTRHSAAEERDIRARVGTGGNTRYFEYTGFDRLGALRYTEPLREDLSLSVNMNNIAIQRAWESLQVDYDMYDFGEGMQEVVERVSPALHTGGTDRFGGNAELLYEQSDRHSYHLRGFYNNYNQEQIRHRKNWIANGDWVRPDSTGREGEQGVESYDLQFNDSQTQQVAVQAGGRHLFDALELQYNLGWAQNRFQQDDFMFPFHVDRADFVIDMEDRSRPSMQVTNWPTLEDGSIIPQRFILQDVTYIQNEHTDNTFTGRLDLDIPYGIGSLKLGSSVRITEKDGDFSNADYDYGLAPLNMWRFGVVRSRVRDIEVFDREEYEIPRLIDPYEAQLFFDSNEPFFDRDRIEHQLNSNIWNYTVSEQIYAGYGMTTLELGDLALLGGVRVEYDNNSNDGQHITFNEDNEIEKGQETANISRTHIFPNAQLKYSLLEGTHVQFAYSRSISRPAFQRIVPFERANVQDSTLFRGNPELEPMISDNLDAQISQYIGRAGMISIGMFHKQLSDFMFETQTVLTEGEHAGFHLRTFENGEETATVYGAEFSFQKYLTFLPGFLSNLGVFANYTWSDSEFDVELPDENDKVRLPGQSSHVVNVALDYSWSRISTRVMYHWTDELPVMHQTDYIVSEQHEDGWQDLSASFRFRLSDNFVFWAEGSGLLGDTELLRSDPGSVFTDYRGGRKLNLGFQFRL